MSFGVAPLFDGELAKSQKRGDDRKSVDELAPIDATGERVLALGDLEDVADDGVIEDRVVELTDNQRQLVDGAITAWAPGRLSPAAAKIKLAARRIGPGVSSYAALRIDVVLEGDTSSPDDNQIVELKETREGVIVHGVPILQGGEWPSPAARAVDTQRRLQARRDADALLGAAQLGGVAFKIRDRESYQRGIDAPDLEDLAGGTDAERDQLRDLARIYGAMLARAHGQALTSERRLGVDVIAPLLVGREAGFANEIATLATGDADQIFADYNSMKDRDLGALIALPGAL